jgi:hypothetical protein
MMKSEILQEFVAMVEANAQSRPSLGEFEMAYQARVAIDRIRFAIKATESTKERTEQLLDALDRLEVAERRFQDRWRRHPDKKQRSDVPVVIPKNGTTQAMS